MQIKDKHLTLITYSISFWIWFLFPFYGLAQLSTRHYIPPIPGQIYQNEAFYNSSFLYISTPYAETRFTIKPIGQSANNWITGVVTNTDSFKIEVSNDVVGADSSTVQSGFTFTDKGFEVVADRGIYVSLRIKADNHAGALVSKGLDALGKDFRVGGMERQEENDFSFFSIMGTQNNTVVEFTADPQLVALNNDGSLPQSIVLNRNESYVALFNGVNCDRFIGTRIQSQNDIVVNTGSILGSFSNEIIDSPDFYFGEEDFGYLNGSDLGFDQLVSLDASVDATEYLLIKGDSFNSIENALIIANENNTLIYLNNNITPISLDAGEHIFIEGNQFTDNPNSTISFINITSNKNIYVFQGTGRRGTAQGSPGGQRVHFYGANQGMFFVPPLSCTSVGDVESIARIDEVDDDTNFSGSLFVLSSYGSAVEVNGQSISSIQNVIYDPGPIQTSTADYQIHRIDDLDGDVSIVGSEELYVSYYNVNNTATSGAFYSGFNLEPKIYPSLSLNTLGNCVDSSGQANVVLQLPNAENYDSLKWQKENSGGTWDYIFTGSSTDDPEYVPNDFGSYRLEVIIDCLSPNNIVYSAAVNVSICPHDSDQDGVVDNIDLDNDNDGVYDKIESLGDFEVDLTTTPPELVVDSKLPYTTPALSQVLSVGNGSFTPFNDGRFTSFLPPKQSIDDAIRFELGPVVPKSLHFSFGFDNSQTVPLEENTYYNIESIDPSESITLLDPDGEIEILVDGDFVGGFAQYNSSKITFRFSNAAVGATTSFRFFASQSSGLVFTHHNESTVNSVFEGHINVLNLDSFSDMDNLADAFDLDSDDDGCFDVVEAGFLDPDNDGRLYQAPLTIDDITVSDRGFVIGHDYNSMPNDIDNNTVYDFQEAQSPAEISPNGDPISVEVCEGEMATFSVDTPTIDAIFQWTVNGVAETESETFIGVNTKTLTINTESATLDTWLDGAEIQVLVSRPTYACPVESVTGVSLSINQIPEAPDLKPMYTYCFDDSATVEDLKGDFGGSVEVFLTGSGGVSLPNETLLVHNQSYYVESFTSAGCVSLTRVETEVFISNPELLSSKSQICLGEEVTLRVNATTEAVWGKIDPVTGLDVIFDGVETSSIVRSPAETTTYFYEMTTNGVMCRVETTIVVHPLPEMLLANDLELCDNAFDGDAYNGRVNGFDLQAQEVAILNGDTSLEVLFFLNESYTDDNRIDKTQPLSNLANPELIYYRIQNKTTGCVSDQTGSFSVQVLPIPPLIDIPPHYECDDLASGSDIDNITTFDLRLNDARIEALLGGAAGQYTISYHTSRSAAEDPTTNGIDSYTMPATDNGQKTIYVRVIDNYSSLSCLHPDNRFDLVLSPLPVIEQAVITFEQCDETDGNSDAVVLTNLRSFESTISANFANEEFSYFTDATRSNDSKISDPTAYYNTDIGGNAIPNQTIYVQVNSILPNAVYAPNGSCVRNAEINIRVAVSQIKKSFMLDFDACELPPSVTQDGKTLFPPTIFDTLTSELLREHTLFQGSGVVIQYYPTLNDAALKTNPIDQTSAYENPNPKASGGDWVDEIWANVEVIGLNTITCIGLKKVANLYIEQLPTAHPVSPFRECDDDDDGVYPFDTSRVYQELTQGQPNISVSYFDTNYNPLFIGVLPNPYRTSDQTIIARVENNPSSNTPSCYEETEIEFIVDDMPNFNPIPTLMLCDDSDGVIDDKATFDTQSIETAILDGQTDIVFAYYDSNGAALPSPLPTLFTTGSTSIRVELINTINNSCISDGYIDFEVIKNPSFDLDQQAVLCLNEGSVDIGIRNPAGDYSFVWEHIDDNNMVTVVGTTPSINIDKAGTYTLTATGLGALACTTSKSIEVLTSELAKLIEKDIVIGGFSSTENTVEILVDNLGLGDYEYTIGNSDFQNEPYFTQIRPGLQTVYVRDRMGCGVSLVQVGVVGYYKYFSPNNDGINDTWQILGLKTTFNSQSSVYIYDRYGRFLTQISGPDESWDGSYQGSPLPADDYWFRLELEDGRVYTGHFSLMR
ncbi:MAG: T9SS type B sorting domain-containing protein [Flavobacteriaceae bacterium]